MATPIPWLLFLSHFAITLEVCLGSLSIWKTHLRISFNWGLETFLQYIHIIFLPHDAIHFVKCNSPSCSKSPPQHDSATPVLQDWDDVLRLASLPFLLQTQQRSLWPNSSIFVSSDQRTFLQKVWSLSPCAIANCSLAFLNVSFGAVASSLISGRLWLWFQVM